MSVSFFTPVINQNGVHGVPTLGDYTERFFDFGQKRCIVSGVDGTTIGAREVNDTVSMKEIALKVAVCVLTLFTVPLAMLIVKCVYRFKYAYIMEQANCQNASHISALDPGAHQNANYNPPICSRHPGAHQNANYHLQDVVDRIKQLAAEGKKMCLILGRKDNEPLPPESDPNVCWISLDTLSTGQIPADRLHLWLSFDKHLTPCLDDVMPDLQGIFDKVVADSCVWHLLGGDVGRDEGEDDSPIEKCFRLLKPNNPTSELIFQEIMRTGFPLALTEPTFNDTGYSLPSSEMNNEEMHKDYKKKVKALIWNKIHKLFNAVHLDNTNPYPYYHHPRRAYRNPPGVRAYYHLMGTKPADAVDTLT